MQLEFSLHLVLLHAFLVGVFAEALIHCQAGGRRGAGGGRRKQRGRREAAAAEGRM